MEGLIQENSVLLLRYKPTHEPYAFFPYAYIPERLLEIIPYVNLNHYREHNIYSCAFGDYRHMFSHCDAKNLSQRQLQHLEIYWLKLFPHAIGELHFLTKVPDDAYAYRQAQACTRKLLQNA